MVVLKWLRRVVAVVDLLLFLTSFYHASLKDDAALHPAVGGYLATRGE